MIQTSLIQPDSPFGIFVSSLIIWRNRDGYDSKEQGIGILTPRGMNRSNLVNSKDN
jgi:Tfp pilus assembly protein PilZ